jgi:hypothetical protein
MQFVFSQRNHVYHPLLPHNGSAYEHWFEDKVDSKFDSVAEEHASSGTKKIWKKAPRPGDYEIVPAPDSVLDNSQPIRSVQV